MDSQTYKPIGEIIEYTTENGPVHTPVATCQGCGSLVTEKSRLDHDQFHQALAELWGQRLS